MARVENSTSAGTNTPGNRSFKEGDGSPVAGHSNSFLPQLLLNSSLWNAITNISQRYASRGPFISVQRRGAIAVDGTPSYHADPMRKNTEYRRSGNGTIALSDPGPALGKAMA
jgi:hypothetical protein